MVKKLITILMVVAVGFGLMFAAGCEGQTDAQSGAGTGALVGAGIGAIVGHQQGRAAEGALIGAAVGGGAGYAAGNESDKKRTQAEIDSLRAEQNIVTIWITNSNGAKIPIRLKKSGPNYIGPRGEYYDHLPTEAELKPVYGF
ncbi:MAG: YMGG-like glycine zipper-containing protein [Planctomycetota bacterium]